MYGENLAEGYHTADEVVNAWMASPEHKANILKPDFTTMGIGIANKNGKNYWAQIFGMA
jgi:uncharacterized protein YkwD